MSNSARRLFQFAIGTGASGIYSPPSGVAKTILRSFDIANTTSSGIQVRLHIVPAGGSATIGNALMYGKVVAAEDVLGYEGEQVIYTGESFTVQALSAGLTITGSGIEVSSG